MPQPKTGVILKHPKIRNNSPPGCSSQRVFQAIIQLCLWQNVTVAQQQEPFKPLAEPGDWRLRSQNLTLDLLLMLETTQLSVSLPVKSFSCSRFSLNHVSSSSSERFSWTSDINRWNKTKEKLLFVFFFVFSIHSSCQANTHLFGSLHVQFLPNLFPLLLSKCKGKGGLV